jgi:hypothetical protein
VEIIEKILQEEYLNKSNIYVPIESSVLERYELDPNDVIYSTLCNGHVNLPGKDRGRAARIDIKWIAHLLITEGGIAFNYPETHGIKLNYPLRDFDFRQWIYYGIEKLPGVLRGGPKFKESSIFDGIKFTVITDPRFETSESFQQRANKFGLFCKLLWAKEMLYEFPEHIYKRKIMHNLKQVLSLIYPDKKFKKIQFNPTAHSEEKEIEEVATVNKCPSCGWILSSKAVKCPRCGNLK